MARPQFDDASRYSYAFCQELIDLMKEWGLPFFDYSGVEANRTNVEAILIMRPGVGFLFYNHGTEKGLEAQGGEDYIIDSKNVSLLTDRIVYTLACLWGRDGGWEAHRKGARAVHCYAETVGFMTSALPEFQESFNYGFKLLHEIGPKFSEILDMEKAKFTELSDKLMDEGNFMAAMWMNTNRDSLRWYNGGSDPPESTCWLRRVAVKLLGFKLGWKLITGIFGF